MSRVRHETSKTIKHRIVVPREELVDFIQRLAEVEKVTLPRDRDDIAFVYDVEDSTAEQLLAVWVER